MALPESVRQAESLHGVGWTPVSKKLLVSAASPFKVFAYSAFSRR
jgi:hypothetical protein